MRHTCVVCSRDKSRKIYVFTTISHENHYHYISGKRFIQIDCVNRVILVIVYQSFRVPQKRTIFIKLFSFEITHTQSISDRPNFRFGWSSAELSDKEKAQKFPTKNESSAEPWPNRTFGRSLTILTKNLDFQKKIFSRLSFEAS